MTLKRNAQIWDSLIAFVSLSLGLSLGGGNIHSLSFKLLHFE